MIKDGQLQQNL